MGDGEWRERGSNGEARERERERGTGRRMRTQKRLIEKKKKKKTLSPSFSEQAKERARERKQLTHSFLTRSCISLFDSHQFELAVILPFSSRSAFVSARRHERVRREVRCCRLRTMKPLFISSRGIFSTRPFLYCLTAIFDTPFRLLLSKLQV